MPKISNTEAAALNAGTVGFDGELFQGNPSLKNLINKYDVYMILGLLLFCWWWAGHNQSLYIWRGWDTIQL